MKASKRTVALAAAIGLGALALLGFVNARTYVVTDAAPMSAAELYDAPAEVVQAAVGVHRYQNPTTGTLQVWDFTKDSEVTNDNDTDSGQSPASYPDWTYTVTGTTAPTVATHAVGGTLAVTNGSSDNDRIEADQTAEWIKLTAGKTYYFAARLKYDCTTTSQADLGFGIGIIDTDWLGDSAIMSDGAFFEINDGDAKLDLVTAYNAASTSDYVRQADIARFTEDTFYKVEMVLIMDPSTNGTGRVIAWVDGAVVYDGYLTNLSYDEELCIKWGLQNGAAEAQVVTIDYLAVGADK